MSKEKIAESKNQKLQIGLFGKQNSGKSALINALLGQDISAVKTTTEPIYNVMEIHGIGPVTIVDTAGLDAEGKRVQKTQAAADKIDVALMLISNDSFELELAWINRLNRAGTIVIPVVSQIDKMPDNGKLLAAAVQEASGKKTVCVSSKKNIGINALQEEIVKIMHN